MKFRICFFFLTLLMVACAPKVQNRQFENPKTDFGPRFGDVDLQDGLTSSANFKAVLSWQGEISSAEFFQTSENILALGKLTESTNLSAKGSRWIEKFYSTEKSTSFLPFADSPYISVAAAQTKNDVTSALGDIRQDIRKAREALRNKISQLGKSFPWPRKAGRLENALQTAQSFLTKFNTELLNLHLSAVITSGIQEAIQKETAPLLKQAQTLIQKIYAAKKFSQALTIADNVISEFQVQLPADLKQSLSKGKKIGQELDSFSDAQGALTVIIDVWRMLDTNEKAQYFRSASADLYDFLKDQNDSELNCLRQAGCDGGLFRGIKKRLFVLPKIKNYGLENLRSQLNQKALAYVIGTVEEMGQKYLPQLPQLLETQIDQGLVSNDKQLEQVQGNYLPFLRDLIKPWAAQKMPSSQGQIAGFENPRVSVSLNDKTPLSLQARGDLSQVSSEVTGSALAALGSLYQQDNVDADFILDSSLSQLNKMLALGGYRDEKNNLVPAFFTPFKDPRNLLDLMTFTSSSESFAATDMVSLKAPFALTDSSASAVKNFSAKALAEQIRGLSSMLKYTRDWKKSRFDEVLGKIQAQDITTEYQADALKRSLFPKDALLALNLGDAAVLLKNITKDFSQVFLLNTENKIIWANDYDFNGNDQAVMAGVVDITNGLRSSTVKSEDVSRMILAISEFLQATEGVEDTTSSYVTVAAADGSTPLKALLEGRQDLRLLTLALANFISNQLTAQNGLVSTTYDINTKSGGTSARAVDQALAIRALLRAREVTHMDIYLWAAQEIYYAMNRRLFSPAQRFYMDLDGSTLGFADKVSTLRTLTELHPYLPLSSQSQLDWVLQPWLKALTVLQ